ncbi:MAG: hotdog fold thioesterase [Deltaproteobacteria bacterium]|nr:hotdog fold thioesterase [Deltaproteobacteria bacterium]
MIKKDTTQLLKEIAGKEPFAHLMNIKVLEIKAGYARVQAKVKEEMLNIHGITHGGALFSLVDEAFELASNSHGTVAVALNMNITFFAPTSAGDILTAEAREIYRANRTATYQIDVTKYDGSIIARCQALVYRRRDPLPGLDKKS